MQMHVDADPSLKPGSIATTTGNTRHPIVLETIGPVFRATSSDADVWALERGGEYQTVTGRDLTADERDAYEFARNPRQALYARVMCGQEHAGGEGMLHLVNLSNDVFSGTQNLHLDGELIVATSYTHIYDGRDIRKARAVALAELPADYAALARELIERAQAAQAEADDEWETL